MSVLYLMEQGLTVARKGERLVVLKSGIRVKSVPIHMVERVIAFGNINFTAPALDLIMRNGVPVAFLSIRWRLKGILEPPRSPDIAIRYAQFRRFSSAGFCLKIAQETVRAKINNQLNVLKRLSKNTGLDFSKEMRKMRRITGKINNIGELKTLLGIEGEASRIYYRAFLSVFPEELSGGKRRKHPPGDPVNSLLSFSYTLLTWELFSILRAHGFDPYLGFYHKFRHGRPALALDMVEPFRAPIADNLVFDFINHDAVSAGDFYEKDGAWLLRKRARDSFLREYERLMRRRLKAPSGKRRELRFLMEEYVTALKNAVFKKDRFTAYRYKR